MYFANSKKLTRSSLFIASNSVLIYMIVNVQDIETFYYSFKKIDHGYKLLKIVNCWVKVVIY